jgi:hypothetical protein
LTWAFWNSNRSPSWQEDRGVRENANDPTLKSSFSAGCVGERAFPVSIISFAVKDDMPLLPATETLTGSASYKGLQFSVANADTDATTNRKRKMYFMDSPTV